MRFLPYRESWYTNYMSAHHFQCRQTVGHSNASGKHSSIAFLVLLGLSVLLPLTSVAGDLSIPEKANNASPIYFSTDVVPILTKLSCNSGGCHGKATGQNGFKLSLLGFEPESDFRTIVKEARGRRLFPSDPGRSLLLLKATSQVPHGGGRRLTTNSDEYQTLYQWISGGVRQPTNLDPTLERIDVDPVERVLTTKATQQLRVTASFSDGTTRDVTQQAVYQSNHPVLAQVKSHGLIQTSAANGLFAVMVRFGDKITTFHGAVPFESDPTNAKRIALKLNQLENQLPTSPLNQHLLRQWKRLRIVPSTPADDATFIRRVTIDICGTLPTRTEVEHYLSDKSKLKRENLIDRLLERPEYASYFALKWGDILQNRGSGYSTSKQRSGTALFAGWIRDSLAMNKPYDQFAAEIVTASGNQRENPPTVWYRQVRTSTDYVESVAQAFLGVRIQCAQCHHHPFERWSQADYFGLAAVFSRIGRKGGFADAEVPTEEIIFVKDRGNIRHPRTGQLVPPRPLGGPNLELSRFEDPRQSFARWMIQPGNPFFARTFVNRIWAHFHGRGMIDPLDDARSTNPPSNPELLNALAQDFVSSGFDVKHLIRTVCNTYSYQLDMKPNEWNQGDTQTFARFYPRRLSAEVLLDGMSQVLDVPTEFAGGPGIFPAGTRAIELTDENVPAHFLDVFGRPARNSACECERVDAPALGQALELVNSSEIHRKLIATNGYLARLIEGDESVPDKVIDVFLRSLGRRPQSEELGSAVEFIESEADTAEAYRSLTWSLLATNEFLFNH